MPGSSLYRVQKANQFFLLPDESLVEAITLSELAVEGPQGDGRRWVEEIHTDNIGLKHIYRWLAAVGVDANAVMAARAGDIMTGLETSEIDSNIAKVLSNGRLAVTVTNYSTTGQNITALRAAYQTATRVEAIMIGDFLGSLTDAQLRSIFSMTQAQVTTLRGAKLTPAASAANTIRAATGG